MIARKIKERIANFEEGKPFSAKDFVDLGNRSTIDKTLSRMVEKQEIEKAIRGMYFKPSFIKERAVPIDLAEVVQNITKKTGEKLQVYGAEAVRQLSLSTQMPLIKIFYTSGKTRDVKVGNRVIRFIHTSNQRLLEPTGFSGLVVSALFYLGKKRMTKEKWRLLRERLNEEVVSELNSLNLPKWMKVGLGCFNLSKNEQKKHL